MVFVSVSMVRTTSSKLTPSCNSSLYSLSYLTSDKVKVYRVTISKTECDTFMWSTRRQIWKLQVPSTRTPILGFEIQDRISSTLLLYLPVEGGYLKEVLDESGRLQYRKDMTVLCEELAHLIVGCSLKAC